MGRAIVSAKDRRLKEDLCTRSSEAIPYSSTCIYIRTVLRKNEGGQEAVVRERSLVSAILSNNRTS